jgi:predicted dehydrogenase
MSEVRVAVVGGGRTGLTHTETLAHRTRGACLVAVTTSSAERAGQMRNSCGEVAIYPGLDQLLEAERLIEAGALIDDGVRSVGDVDNAVVSVRFGRGAVGTMRASGVTRYGHDLRTEVIGDEGAVQVGYFRQTPVRLLDRKGVHHDTPHSTPDRMGDAFVDCVRDDTDPPVSTLDGRATVAVSLAATRSIRDCAPVEVNLPMPPQTGPHGKPSSPKKSHLRRNQQT